MKAEGAALSKFEEIEGLRRSFTAGMAGVSPGLFLFLPHVLQVLSEYPERAGSRSQHGSVFYFISSNLCLLSRQRKQAQLGRLLSPIYLNLGQFSRSAPTVTWSQNSGFSLFFF